MDVLLIALSSIQYQLAGNLVGWMQKRDRKSIRMGIEKENSSNQNELETLKISILLKGTGFFRILPTFFSYIDATVIPSLYLWVLLCGVYFVVWYWIFHVLKRNPGRALCLACDPKNRTQKLFQFFCSQERCDVYRKKIDDEEKMKEKI